MNKRGFTLIELLAVIVILAIIAVITVPIVSNIIVQAQESSDLESARSYVVAAEQYQSKAIGNSEMKEKMYSNIFTELKINGTQAEKGTVKFERDGNLYVSVIINSRCYLKNNDESVISYHEDINDCIPDIPNRCFEYEPNETGITITSYKCGESNKQIHGTREYFDVTIPSMIDDKPVTVLADSSFNDRGLTSVTIPDSVIDIDDSAFEDNSIRELILGNSIEYIGDSAFSNNKISSLVLPTSLNYIDNAGFFNNNISELTFGSNLEYIGNSAFNNNKISSLVIPNNVTSIGDSAFSNNKISSLVISNNVTSIGAYAFIENKIETVTIPNSVTSIGTLAFGNNSTLKNIRVDNYPSVITGEPWGATNAEITYLRGVHINIESSLTGLVTKNLQVASNSEIIFKSTDPFKTITSVTIDGIVYSGNTYTVGTTDINVTAYTYEETDSTTIESEHPYTNNLKGTIEGTDLWTFSDDNVTSYTITFDDNSITESKYDFIYIYDSSGTQLYKLSSTAMAGNTYTVNGTDLKIRLTSDSSNVYYGFKATITKNI